MVFSFERHARQGEQPYYKYAGGNYDYFVGMGMPDVIKSVEKVDDYTVKFTLNAPNAPFLADLAMDFASIMSKEYADKLLADGQPEQLNQQPVGTGPFNFVDYQKDAVIRYKANPDYWDGKQAIDDLVFAITPDASVRLQKLKAGECQIMAYPSPADIRCAEGRSEPQRSMQQPGLNVAYLAYNTSSRRSTTRRCARRSTWRSTSRRSSTPSIRAPARSAKNPIPPTMWSYNDDVKDDPYDPEAAKKMLADAGVTEPDDEDLGDAGAASLQAERQAHGRADAGRPRQDRRQGRTSSPTNGAEYLKLAGDPKHDGAVDARLDRRQRRSRTTSWPSCSAATASAPPATSPPGATSRSTT